VSKKWKVGEFENRVLEVLGKEQSEPVMWHYVSFAKSREEGGCQGVVLIQGRGITDCLLKINMMQANPGGEVMAIPIPSEAEHNLPPIEFRNRLLSKEEVYKLWPDAKTLEEHEEALAAQSKTPEGPGA
jgi:hypothetical protein